MSFAIMRCKKLKSMGSVSSSLQHYFRERETKNADPELTAQNSYGASKTTNEAMGNLRDRLPEKYRKDAVLAVEYMMTASPEWWAKASKQEQAEFITKSGEWLFDKYGKENVIAFGVHRDEKTPHVSAYVVPRTADGRLSAKEFIGNREKMSQDQTDYAAKVQHLGLERGIEGSTAKHVTIQQYYARVNSATPKAPKVDVPEPSVKDRINPTEYGHKIAQSVINQLQPAFLALQAKSQQVDLALGQVKVADAARRAAEASKEIERNKAQKLASTLKDVQQTGQQIMQTIVKGGDALDKLQLMLQEKFKAQEKTAEPKRDKGFSR